jgi:hypothetical protein
LRRREEEYKEREERALALYSHQGEGKEGI